MPESPAETDVLAVVGTRPEFIKIAPLFEASERWPDLEISLVHTGQHYDGELSATFFETLGLPEPDVHLGVGSGSHADQTGEALQQIGDLIETVEPAVVTAVGDTNAVLSAALAASKTPPAFAHIEAGIRSYDRTMPEEVNRVLADHVSDALYAPTDVAAENLSEEGIDENVVVSGNPVVDSCRRYISTAESKSDVLSRLGLGANEFVVATIHRPRNTDDHDRLHRIASALDSSDLPVVFPAHPRTRAAIDSSIEVDGSGSLLVVDALGYLDFLKLLANARVVVTDSGGIQEEAAVLEVPCLTVRPNTERPETVAADVNELVEPESLGDQLDAVVRDAAVRDSMTGAPDLFGDGNAGERIVRHLAEHVL